MLNDKPMDDYEGSYGSRVEKYYKENREEFSKRGLTPDKMKLGLFKAGKNVEEGDSFETWSARHKMDRFSENILSFEESERQALADEETRKRNLAERDSFMRGLHSGIDQLQGAVGGGGLLMLGKLASYAGGDNVVSKYLTNKGFDVYQEQMRQASLNPTKSLLSDKEGQWLNDELQGPEDYLDAVAGVLGNLAPSMAVGLISGGLGAAGGALAKEGVKGAFGYFVKNQAQRMLAKGLVKDVVEEGVTKVAAQQVAEGMAKKYVGGRVGAILGTAMMESTGSFAEAVDHMRQKFLSEGMSPEQALLKATEEASGTLAMGTGLAAGLVEIFGGNIRLLDMVLGDLEGKATKELIKAATHARANPGIRGAALNAMRDVLGEAVKQMPAEFGQEATQEILAMLNVDFADPDFEILSQENFKRVVESGLAGAIGGAGGAFATQVGERAKAAVGKAETPQSRLADLKVQISRQEAMLEKGQKLPGLEESLARNRADVELLQKHVDIESNGVTFAEAVAKIQKEAPDKNGKPFTVKALKNLVRHGNLATIDQGVVDKESLDAFIASRKPAGSEETSGAKFAPPKAKPVAEPEAPVTGKRSFAVRPDQMDDAFSDSMPEGDNSPVPGDDLGAEVAAIGSEVDKFISDDGEIEESRDLPDLKALNLEAPAAPAAQESAPPLASGRKAFSAADFSDLSSPAMRLRYFDARSELASTPDVENEIATMLEAGSSEQDIVRKISESGSFPSISATHVRALAKTEGLKIGGKPNAMLTRSAVGELHSDPYWAAVIPEEEKEHQRRFAGFVEDWLGVDGAEALSKAGLLDEMRGDDRVEGKGAEYDSGELRASFDPSQIKTKEDAISAVMHEVGGHHGVEAMVNKMTSLKGWNNFRGMVKKAAQKDADVMEAFNFVVNRYVNAESAREDMAELRGKTVDEMFENDVFLHEVVARMSDYAAKNRKGKMGQALSWLRDKVVAFLRSVGVNIDLGAAELARLLEGSVKNVIKTKNAGINPERLHAGNMEYMARHGYSTSQNPALKPMDTETPRTKEATSSLKYAEKKGGKTVEMPELKGNEKTTGRPALREDKNLKDYDNASRPESDLKKVSEEVDISEMEPKERAAEMKRRSEAKAAAQREQGRGQREFLGETPVIQKEDRADFPEAKILSPRQSAVSQTPEAPAPGEPTVVEPHEIKSGKRPKFFDSTEEHEPIRTYFPPRSKEHAVGEEFDDQVNSPADAAPTTPVSKKGSAMQTVKGQTVAVGSRASQTEGLLAPAGNVKGVPMPARKATVAPEETAEQIAERTERVKEIVGDTVPQVGLGVHILRMSDGAFAGDGTLPEGAKAALVHDEAYRTKVGELIVEALKAAVGKKATMEDEAAAIRLVMSSDLRDFLRSSSEAIVGAWWFMQGSEHGSEGRKHNQRVFKKLGEVRQAMYDLRDAVEGRDLPESFLESIRVFEQEYKMMRSIIENAEGFVVMRNIQAVTAARAKMAISNQRALGQNSPDVPRIIKEKSSYFNFTTPGEWYLETVRTAIQNLDLSVNTAQKDLSVGAKQLLASMQATIRAQSIFKGRMSDDAAADHVDAAEMIIADSKIEHINQGLVTRDEAEVLAHAFRPLRRKGESEEDLPGFTRAGLELLRKRFKDFQKVVSNIIPIGTTGLFRDGMKNFYGKNREMVLKLDKDFETFIWELYEYAYENLLRPIANDNARIDLADFDFGDDLNKIGFMVEHEREPGAQRLVEAIEALGMKVPSVSFPMIPNRVVNGERVSYLDVLVGRFREFRAMYEKAPARMEELSAIAEEDLTAEQRTELAELEILARQDGLYALTEDEFIIGVVGLGSAYARDEQRMVYQDMPADLFKKLYNAGLAGMITDPMQAGAINMTADELALPKIEQRKLWRGLAEYADSAYIKRLMPAPLFAQLSYKTNARQATFLNNNLAPMNFGVESDLQFLDLRSIVPGAILYDQGNFYIVSKLEDGQLSYYEVSKATADATGTVSTKFKITTRSLADMKDVSVVPRIWDLFSSREKKGGKFQAFDDYSIYDVIRTAKAKSSLKDIAQRTGAPISTATFAHMLKDAVNTDALYLATPGGSHAIFKVVDELEVTAETTERDFFRMITTAIADSVPATLRSIRKFSDGSLDVDGLIKAALAHSRQAILEAQQKHGIPEPIVEKYMNLRLQLMDAYLRLDDHGRVQRAAERLYAGEAGTGRERVPASLVISAALSRSGIQGLDLEVLGEDYSKEDLVGMALEQAVATSEGMRRDGDDYHDGGDEMSGTEGYMIESKDSLLSGVSDAAVQELINLPEKFSPDFSGVETMKAGLASQIQLNKERREFIDETIKKLSGYLGGLELEHLVAATNPKNRAKALALFDRAKKARDEIEKEAKELRAREVELKSPEFLAKIEESQRTDWERLNAKKKSMVLRVKSAPLAGVLFDLKENEAGRLAFSWPVTSTMDDRTRQAFSHIVNYVDTQVDSETGVETDVTLLNSVYDKRNGELLNKELTIEDIENNIYSPSSPLGKIASRFILASLATAPAWQLELMGLNRNMVRVAIADSLQGMPVLLHDKMTEFRNLSKKDKAAAITMIGRAWWYRHLLNRQVGDDISEIMALDSWIREDRGKGRDAIPAVTKVVREEGYFGSYVQLVTEQVYDKKQGRTITKAKEMLIDPVGLPETELVDAEGFSIFAASGFIHPTYASFIAGRTLQESMQDLAIFNAGLAKASRMAAGEIFKADRAGAKTIDDVPGMKPRASQGARAISTSYVDDEAFGEVIRNEVAERFLQRCMRIDPDADTEGLRSMAVRALELIDEGHAYKMRSGKTKKSWKVSPHKSKEATFLAVEKAFAGYEYLQADLLGIARRIEEEGLGHAMVAYDLYSVGKPIENIESLSSFVSQDGTQYVKMSVMEMADGDQPHLSKFGDAPTTADKKLMQVLEYVIPGYFGKIEKGGAKTNPNYTTPTNVDGESVIFVDDTFITSFGHEIIDRLRRLHDIALQNPMALGYDVSRRIRNVWDGYIKQAYGQQTLTRVREENRRTDMAQAPRTRLRPTGTPFHELKDDVDTSALKKLAEDIIKGLDFVKADGMPEIIVHQRGVHGDDSTMEALMRPDDAYVVSSRGGDTKRSRREMYGFVDKRGVIHIFAGAHALQDGSFDRHEFMKTVLHEVVGHKGLKSILGPDYNAFMVSVFNKHVNVWGDVSLTDEYKVFLAEEYMAGLVENIRYNEAAGRLTNPNIGTLFDKLMGMVMKAVRAIAAKVGIKIEISSFEVRELVARGFSGTEIGGRTGMSKLFNPSLVPGENLPQYASFGGYEMNWVDTTFTRLADMLRPWQMLERSMTEHGRRLDQPVLDALHAMAVTGREDRSLRARLEGAMMNFMPSLRTVRSRVAERVRRAYELEKQYMNSFAGMDYDSGDVSLLAQALHTIERMEFIKAQGRRNILARAAARKEEGKRVDTAKLASKMSRFLRNVEANTKYTGLDRKQAEAVIEQAIAAGLISRAEGGTISGKAKKQLDMLHEASTRAMKESVAAGLMTSEDYRDWVKNYKFYVTIPATAKYGFLSAKSGLAASGAGRFNKAAEAMLGVYMPADVAGATFAGYRMRIVESEVNKTNQTVFNFALFNPNRDVFRLTVPRSTVDMLVAAGKIQNSEVAIQEYLLENGLEVMEDSVVSLPMAKLKDYEQRNELVPVYIDGQLCHIKIVHKALRRAFNLHMAPGRPGRYMQALGKINRWLVTCATMLSPEFWIANQPRDASMAFLMLSSRGIVGNKKGTEFAKDFGKHVYRAMRFIWMKNFGKDTSGLGEKYASLEKYYENFALSGGKIQWLSQAGSVQTMQEIEKGVRLIRGTATRGEVLAAKGMKVYETMESISDAFENATRLAVFTAAMENGMSQDDAALMAREITVDFDRKGEMGQFINTLYMFANAGIQANLNMARVLIKNPRQAAKVLGSVVAFSFSLAMMNFVLGGDGEDDEPAYDSISQEVRNGHIVVMMPFTDGKAIKIPFAYGFGFYWALGQELASTIMGRRSVGEAGAGALASMMNNFNPLETAAGLGDAHGWARMISPTITDPLVDLYHEQTPFGTPLMPEKAYDAQPDSQRHWRSVSVLSKSVAQGLNSLTGGSAAESGFIDVSPESLDLAFESMTGGLGKFLTRTAGLIISPVTGKEIALNDLPGVRRLATDKQTWVDRGRFKSNYEEISGVWATLRSLNTSVAAAQDPDLKAAAKRDRDDFMRENQRILAMRKMANNVYHQAKMVDAQKELLYKSGLSAAEVAKKMKPLNERQRAIYSDFNRRYYETVDMN